jgi:hypothetical protein
MASEELRRRFQEIKTEGDLQSLIDGGEKEDLYLECKKKQNASEGDLSDIDKRNFSESLSQFANSDGGILLWGIETDTTVSDRLVRRVPFAEPGRFEGALRKSVLNSTQPPVDGVLIETIDSSQNLGKGYVKCLIPASDRAPHRAMLTRAKGDYLRRSADGKRSMDHYELEDMFGRRPRPRLEISTETPRIGTIRGGPQGSSVDVHVELLITNVGRATAQAPFARVTVLPPYTIKPRGLTAGADLATMRPPIETNLYGEITDVPFMAGGNAFLHVGITYELCSVTLSHHQGQAVQSAKIAVSAAAVGAELSHSEFTIAAALIAEKLPYSATIVP